MAEEQKEQSRKEAFMARMQERYPDKDFGDEEALFAQISDDYDQSDGDRESIVKLDGMFEADPRSAQFLTDMADGKSPWANYIRIFGPELKEGLEDPDTIAQIAEAEKDYVERVARNKELETEYETNMEGSLATLRNFQEERGLSDEELDEVVAAMIGIVRDGIMGKFLPETLEMVMKGINHDADVEAAAEEGEVAGRNAKITEQLKKSQKGDGTEPLGGKNGQQGGGNRAQNIFDLAAQAR